LDCCKLQCFFNLGIFKEEILSEKSGKILTFQRNPDN